MIEIAILGYGVVGSGVAEVCEVNRETIKRRAGTEINVKKILDIRSFPGDPFADRITADPDEIFNDPSITMVVETIGGVGIAYELSCRALQNHKHVVTSNKELVATYGPELMALAQANGVNYMFEASVGGGIPIIRPLHKCLSANIVVQIAGILNGTTNFILTRMDQDGIGFAEALSEAQALGYAEQNPAADIEGTDACRKIAILASIAYSEYIDSRLIYTEGIASLTAADMKYAARLGCKLKLIGRFLRRADGRADLIVAPMLIPREHPVSVADGVYNAILVEGNALGEAMFYGRGAGRMATASAVVADVIECAMHIGKQVHLVPWTKPSKPLVLPHGECPVRALVRLSDSVPVSEVEANFSQFGLTWLQAAETGEIAFVTGGSGNLTENELQRALTGWPGKVLGRIRLF